MRKLLPLVIFILALVLRLCRLDWDSGQHLHPDERFLTMVTTAIHLPSSFLTYFDPTTSPMNPGNVNYPFFVYGTFPLFFTKIISIPLNLTAYHQVYLVGRTLSAIFDAAIVLLLFRLIRRYFNYSFALLAAFIYAILVLPIQLSHFFAVDTFLNFFLFLTFFNLTYPRRLRWFNFLFVGTSFGLALASKMSAAYFAPILLFTCLYRLQTKPTLGFLYRIISSGFIFVVISLIVFRFVQPSAFAVASWFNWQPNPDFINSLAQLRSFNQPNTWFPPAIQWKTTTPIIFPLINLLFWGIGLPLGIIFLTSVISTALHFCRLPKTRWSLPQFVLFISFIWILFMLVFQGSQFCKTMRYFLPIYPFVALLSAFTLDQVKRQWPWLFRLLLALVIIYPLSFLAIYTHPTTRVTASNWIYEHIPAGSTLALEHWDDPLPLNLPDYPSSVFDYEMLSLYDDDTPAKWAKINSQLDRTDYVILSSNRLYATIPLHPVHYPQTSSYYHSLFDGTLGFKLVAQISSYPCFPPVGRPLFCFNDDWAEEAFTVYDHPKVLIFQKVKTVSPL